MFSCWGPILHQKRFPASTFDSKITKYMACKHAKSHHLTRLGKRYFLGLTAWCSRIRKIGSAIKWLFFFVNFKKSSQNCVYFFLQRSWPHWCFYLFCIYLYSTSSKTRLLVGPILHIFLWCDVKSQLRKWRHLLNFCNWTELNVWSAIVCIIDCMKSWGGRVLCLSRKKKIILDSPFHEVTEPFSYLNKKILHFLFYKSPKSPSYS